MRAVLISCYRALRSQLHIRMLLLTLLPFGLSLLLWGALLWWRLQFLIDWLQEFFIQHDGFHSATVILGWFNLLALKTVIVPFLAMWALLPLMILTALVLVGLCAVPVIARHVGRYHYPALAKRHGGSVLGSLWTSLWCFAVFVVLWLLTLPLTLIPPLALVLHPLLWGWLTYRVMAYDTLADYASAEERQFLLHRHRWALLTMGAVAGTLGTLPTLLWLGGALSVIFFPLLAAVAIWLYVLVFVFTGLWFQYYCLQALLELRLTNDAAALHR
ncbi:EI24 domain-containing protein [Herbaspirillum sp. RTI4]|uniref:EI24 domain-containing protein n=1 Tax=Herbaspirillum sp. RTI4 TaxID=3048640 RepID=UPI002AB347E9|nr:EI24 domain-containing protein [Herbaspirillum sp. RTI4]MDY7579705.1 EI24 domain-containing protein [Herbaspirillum sp. RTI4]MEA9983032.1 EI24 domain-containing protein [Herbaspirillum sp. RTI4]